MATSEQVKALIKAHSNSDKNRFKTIVLQIAAYESQLKHDSVAKELKKMANELDTSTSNILQIGNISPYVREIECFERLVDLIVTDELNERIERILSEQRNKNKLRHHGLSNRRKILLEGNPGTGKTFSASVIAYETQLPLYSVQTDKLVTKFMGETSSKLRQLFDSMEKNVGVYFFDEFDAIGADRNLDNEVGEMRRILNSFLQFMEDDTSESIIIAATNNHKMLDQALFRRFDDVLHYDLPNELEIARIYNSKILGFQADFQTTKDLLNESCGLSQAEIIRICDDALKDAILNDVQITEEQLLLLIKQRLLVYSSKEA